MLSYAHDLHLLKTRVQDARQYSKRDLPKRWHSLQKHLWKKVNCEASDQVARSDSNSQPSRAHSSAAHHDPKMQATRRPISGGMWCSQPMDCYSSAKRNEILIHAIWINIKTQHSKIEDHGIQSHRFVANRWGNNGNRNSLYFPGLQNHCSCWLQPWN